MRKTMGAPALFTTGGDFNHWWLWWWWWWIQPWWPWIDLSERWAMVMNIMLNVSLMFGAHTKYTSSITFQRAFWPMAQSMGQGGHLHPLPPPWLLVQGDKKYLFLLQNICFDKVWFRRPWYSATGGWQRWSPWCSSSSNTPLNINFQTSRSAGQYVGCRLWYAITGVNFYF